jgi:formylglycine-generating enzyme required for sulfatase activity
VRGARLCTAREWERAARGADGRSYPHGESLVATDANFDLTYGQQPLAYGPDEVGTHAASDSPFGVADLAGNALEWIRGLTGGPWMKGGSWYHGVISALSNNGGIGEETQRDVRIGIRVCADPAR